MTEAAVFDRLSAPQLDTLCNVAFGGDGGYCNPRTLQSLAAKGLIEQVDVPQADGFVLHKWTMPIAVHIDFCAWCDANVSRSLAAASDGRPDERN